MIIKSILATALIACSNFSAISQQAISPGAVFKGNQALTGVYNTKPAYGLDEIAYRFTTGGAIRSTVTLEGNNLFFGSSDGNVYCVNATTGKELWKFHTDGPVTSSAAIYNGVVYFSSRDGYLYAVNEMTGNQAWKFGFKKDLTNLNYWDFYLSSPNISENVLYIGSGDGNLYAFNLVNHRLKWKFNSNSRIRATPAVDGKSLVFGTMDGYVYSLNKNSGEQLWRFATDGASIPFERDENDRTSIYCSPAISEGTVIIGGRDGFGYAIDLSSGKEKWRVNHNGSWVLGTGIKDGVAYFSSGSSYFVQAVDLNTGTEKWRFKTKGAVFSSVSITGDLLYFADIAGNIYGLNRITGNKIWMLPLGYRIFATPVVYNGKLFCGTDEGTLVAVQGTTLKNNSSPSPSRKIVYWEGKKTDSSFQWFTNNTDLWIRDYFKTAGYELMNESSLRDFMLSQIQTKTTSVVVLADNKIPASIVNSQSGSAIVRQYLNNNGKMVFFGDLPLIFIANPLTGVVDSLDYDAPKKIMDISYPARKEMMGYHVSMPTEAGRRLGLQKYWTGITPVHANQVSTVFARDEFGLATGWIKTYGNKNSGLLQLSIPRMLGGADVYALRTLIEKGIEW
ncbi:MAG: hypothetical protein JWN76_1597 [Chitinophagaceae bacterium]|nr:hypothetical protein [Chitinophagaceae bacterium]